MSLAILEKELLSRDDNELIPDFFTYDLLIVLVRDMTGIAKQHLTPKEMQDIGKVLRSYIRRIIALRNEDHAALLDCDTNLFFECLSELYGYAQDELVSRLTDCLLRDKNFDDYLGELVEVYIAHGKNSQRLTSCNDFV